MQIVFEVLGEKQVNRDLLRIGEYAGDAAPAFSAIADLIMEETTEQFATEGGHASGGWAPLAESTQREKARLGFGSRGILERSLALEHSLTVRGDGNQILDVQPDGLDFGTSLRYGEFHQLGTSRMPQRRPVELTEDAKRRIVKVLQRWIMTGELATL